VTPLQLPPSWARTIVASVLPRHDRAAALADLDELFARRARTRGWARALVWYLTQLVSFPLTGARSRAADSASSTMEKTNYSLRRALTTDVAQDTRLAIRSLARSPGFSLTVLGTLGLGLAGAITIFALVYGILLTPLPYEDPGQLVAIFTTDLGKTDRSPSAPANVLDWQRDNHTVEHLTAAHPWSATLLADEPRKLIGLRAMWPLFDLLGAKPMLGRTWHAADSLRADVGLVVLGHALWQREFGGDSAVVGRTVRLNAEPYEVLGVMPADFGFPPFWASEAEFWVPLDFGPEPSRRAQFVRVFGRMRRDIEVAEVQSDFSLMNQRLTLEYPEDLGGLGVYVEPLHEPVVSQARPVLLGLLGATVLLLLVAVANVANLMLARALARDRDRAVRMALGAPRRRLIMHELAQSTLLGGVAGVFGLALASMALRGISAMAFLDLPRVAEVRIDGVVVAVSLAGALLIGLVFGLVAAARDSSGATLLRAGAGQTSPRAGRVRDALVVAEVALAVVLLAGAGLTVRSLARQMQIETGLAPEGVLTLTIDMGGTSLFPPDAGAPFSGDTLSGVERQMQFFRQIVDRSQGLPGVVSAGIMSHLPLAGDVWATAVSRADRPPPPSEERLNAVTRIISPDYLQTMGMTLVSGRSFAGWGEDDGDEVLINRALASTLWPGVEPLGQRLRLGSDWDDPSPVVVGVVSDVTQGALVDGVKPEFYRPYGQNPFPWNRQTSLAIRTSGQPTLLAGTVRAMIRELEPAAPVTDIRTMSAIIEEELFAARAVTSLVAVFAAFAVLVSGLGLFGVINYLVGQRRREFGIRMALGSSPGSVARLVVGQGFVLMLVGVVVGGVITASGAGLVNGLLYQVEGRDPVAFAGASLGLLLVGLLAVWLPARRAAAADPVECLRAE
jgi:putative ABC transport system permease protein